MKFACFDIETIPNQNLPDGVKPEFDPQTLKLGNTKDPEKIQEKIDNAKKDFDEALDKKMSLDPDLCEIVCFVGLSEENNMYWIGFPDDGYHTIEYAWKFIKAAYLNHIPLISFNGIQFDLPALLHQAMHLNIPVSPQMYADLTKKYDNRYHYDLMQILAGWDRTKYKPLDFYLKLFGIGEKVGEGSDVYDWWKSREHNKIREHCENDVRMMAKLFDRLKDWIVKESDREV